MSQQKWNHIMQINFVVESRHPEGDDITPDMCRQSIEESLKDFEQDPQEFEEVMFPVKESYPVQMAQADWRISPDKCPACLESDFSVEDPDGKGDWAMGKLNPYLYQVRCCNECEERWTVCFEPRSYLMNN